MNSGLSGARSYASRVLSEVEKGAYTHVALGRWRKASGLSAQDWNLVTELVYGVVRYRKRLEWVMEQYAGRASKKLEPGVRRALFLALYQLDFLPQIPERAVVHQAVEQARAEASAAGARLVNGLLRNYLRQNRAIDWPDQQGKPARYLAVKCSHPQWLVTRWLERFGFEETYELLEANNSPRPLTGRFNTLLGAPVELARKLRGEGLRLLSGRYFPEAFRATGSKREQGYFDHPSFRAGCWTVQDEGSMAPGWVLRPRPGEKVLDACAGPGGKTGHLAQLMQDQGQVVAADIHRHRLQMVQDNCSRLGIKNVHPLLQDASKLAPDLGSFQRILVDAPCSGTGVLGRRPDARWRRQEPKLEELQQLQLAILRRVARVLSPGGVLVYSTCSLEAEENQHILDAFLSEFPGFVLESATPWLPVALTPSVTAEGWAELFPHRHGTDGMFVARMRRAGKTLG